MPDLSRLMQMLLHHALAGARGVVRRYRLSVVLGAVAALVATMGLAMLVAGVFLLLAESMAAPAAAAMTGGGLVAVAGLIGLAVWLLGRTRSRRRPAATNGTSGIIDLVGAAIAADARSETPLFAVAALLAGCAIGASPQLRCTIADLFCSETNK